MVMARQVEVHIMDLPLAVNLMTATHRVLYERLMGGVSIDAWNELLVAHDAIADMSSEED